MCTGVLQVEVSTRENKILKALLRYLQLQPEAAIANPSLASFEALKNDMVASPADTIADLSAAAAPTPSPVSQDCSGGHGPDDAPNSAPPNAFKQHLYLVRPI